MRNARAIVNSLLETSSPEDVDWGAVDLSDPDSTGPSMDVPMTLPGATSGEPLLRMERFRELAKAHGGGYVQRTGWYRPQRDQYSGYTSGPKHFTFPHGARIHKLDGRTFVVFWPDGAIGIQLHGTVLVKRNADGSYVASSGGYPTTITFARMDEYLPFGWMVSFKRSEGKGFWMNRSTGAGSTDGRRVEFTDGDKIQSDGVLVPQAPPVYRRVRKKRDEPTAQ